MVKQLEKRNEQDGNSPNTQVKSREVAFICGRDRAKSPRNTCKPRLKKKRKKEREREREREREKQKEKPNQRGLGVWGAQHTNSVSDKSNLLA
jgi:hypothetical protein